MKSYSLYTRDYTVAANIDAFKASRTLERHCTSGARVGLDRTSVGQHQPRFH